MKVMQQGVAPRQSQSVTGKMTFSQIISTQQYQAMLSSAIQNEARRQRFITTLISAVNTTPKLKECDPNTIISAALQMEALGLASGLGDAYLIPYGSVATFQMGVRGYRTLAMRSGQYLDIDNIEIREGEYKGRNPMNGKPIFEFISDDDERENLPIVGYLAYFTLLNGFQASVYFSHNKMLQWADRYSPSFEIDLYKKYLTYLETGEGLTDKELKACAAPWYSNFEAQAGKTVIKQLLSKKGILSVELIDALRHDQSDGTTDGLIEMSFSEEQKETEPAKEEVAEKATMQQETVVTQAPRRGRPPKVVHAVVEENVSEPPEDNGGDAEDLDW